MISRRETLKVAGGFLAAGLAWPDKAGVEAAPGGRHPTVTIQDVEIERGVVIQAGNGTRGSFAGSSSQDLESLQPHWGRIRELLIGKDPFDPSLGGELLWDSIYPGKAFLDRQCVDYVQTDPVWCGGISEWLKVCALVRQYPGVKVVPHITSPWLAAPHCVAAQPEDLCPLLEFNYEGGREALESHMTRSPTGDMLMRMPDAPGLS